MRCTLHTRAFNEYSPRSVELFKPVSAMKLTVAWNRFAFLKHSMTMFTSSVRS